MTAKQSCFTRKPVHHFYQLTTKGRGEAIAALDVRPNATDGEEGNAT